MPRARPGGLVDRRHRVRTARGRGPLRRARVRSARSRGRRDRVHDLDVGLPGGDDRPELRRPADHVHVSRRSATTASPTTAMESDGVHARAAIMRAAVDRDDAPERRQGVAQLAGRPGDPGDHRRRHARARPPHPRPGRDARRGVPGGALRATGARADRRRAGHGRPRPVERRHSGADESSWATATTGPRIAMIDTGVKRSIVRNLTQRGATVELAPVHRDPGRPAPERPRRDLPGQRPRRPRRRSATSSTRQAADRQAPRLRDLPRPSAALPRGRPRDLQAAVRPPRREPPGQGPDHRSRRDHEPEPRLRGPRPGRRQDDRPRRGGSVGHRLRRRRAHPHQPVRPHGRRAGAQRRPGRHRPVPPRGRPRTERRAPPVRPVRGGDPQCRVGTTSTRSS